jgi:hypothetical protein
MWGTRFFARRTVMATQVSGAGTVVFANWKSDLLLFVAQNPHMKIRRVGHPLFATFGARNRGTRVLRADDNSAR